MRVALESCPDVGIDIIRRALKEEGVGVERLRPTQPTKPGVTHVVGLPGVSRSHPSSPDVQFLMCKPAIVHGSFFLEPDADRARIGEPRWYGELTSRLEYVGRDPAIAVAMQMLGPLGAATAVDGSVMAPVRNTDGRPTLIVAASVRDAACRFGLHERFELVEVEDCGAAAAQVALAFGHADAVLCRDTPLLYRALRAGFRPVVLDRVPCGLADCVEAVANEGDLALAFPAAAADWRLSYQQYCAFETFAAAALCMEAVQDTPAGRAEVVRRLRNPHSVPPLRLEPLTRNRFAAWRRMSAEIVHSPRPWIADAWFELRRRIRRGGAH